MFPPRTIDKKGNFGLAGFAWETTQITMSTADARSGIQLFPAPELYQRANHLSSVSISCSQPAADALLFFSGVSRPCSLIVNIDTHSHGPIFNDFIDPISFPTGVAVKLVADEAFDVYITAKYFVE